MRTAFRQALPVAAVLFLLGCDLAELAGTARYRKDFHYRYDFPPGGRLSVENCNGPVEILHGKENEVVIDGTRFASSPELLAALKVEVVKAGDLLQVRTLRPSGYRGSMGVRYTIHTPRKIELDRILSTNGAITVRGTEGPARLKTSNGRITLTHVTGDVEARTSNGGIRLTGCRGGAVLATTNGSIHASALRGRFSAATSNGGITATIAAASGPEPVRVRTSNGSIRLTLLQAPATDVIATTSNAGITLRAPATLAAQVKLSTANGSVQTDFPVQVEGTQRKTRLEGTIHGGGPILKLTCSNGSLRLLQLSSSAGPGH